MGWLIFYAGITKVLDPAWSAEGYLKGAKTFSGFYEFMLNPSILPMVNFLNEWGLIIVGAALILGAFVRLSSFFGALLMFLYYLPILEFPYVGGHSFIVDDHIIYILVFAVLAAYNAGRVWGLDKWLFRSRR